MIFAQGIIGFFRILIWIQTLLRVPIADIFQTKKRKKRQIDVTTTTGLYDDEYDFWGGEYNDYENDEDELDVQTHKQIRIDFSKYGKNSTES